MVKVLDLSAKDPYLGSMADYDIELTEDGDRVKAQLCSASASVWAHLYLRGPLASHSPGAVSFPPDVGGFFVDSARNHGLHIRPSRLLFAYGRHQRVVL